MDATDWLDRAVAEPGGVPYGRLDELFVGRDTGRPTFGIVSLNADPEGKRVMVPLHHARPERDVLALPLDRHRVASAPAVRAEVAEIPPEAGRYVLEHFGLAGGDEDPTTQPMSAVEPPVADAADDDADAEVTLSEEQLVVDAVPRAAERVRVRKVVVTEEVTVTVTVRREELVIEREPLDDPATEIAWAEDATADSGAVEFVLHAEEPVVTKRVVPLERVRVHRDTIVEERRITDEVRKERLEVEQTPLQEEPHR